MHTGVMRRSRFAGGGACVLGPIPIDVQRAEVGSLSVYLDRPGSLDPDLLITAMAVANQAEVLLGELRRRDGLSAGAAVDRAVGLIIAQRAAACRRRTTSCATPPGGWAWTTGRWPTA